MTKEKRVFCNDIWLTFVLEGEGEGGGGVRGEELPEEWEQRMKEVRQRGRQRKRGSGSVRTDVSGPSPPGPLPPSLPPSSLDPPPPDSVTDTEESSSVNPCVRAGQHQQLIQVCVCVRPRVST